MRYYYLKPARRGQTVDTPVLSVNPSSLTLDRSGPGSVATFTASLSLDPGSAVAVTVTSSDPSVTVSPASFALGGGNPVARSVAVTGATAGPDAVTLAVTAPGQTTRTITISRPPVPLELAVTPASLSLDRVAPGNVGTFTAALNRVPESSVLVSVSSSDASVAVSPVSFSLASGNPPSQLVTLTGNATGPGTVTINLAPVGLTAKSVTVTRPSFTPAAIPNLALWIDAADASTLTLDGSNHVETWHDKSGNGHDLTQASVTLRPAYVTNVLNGNPVVRSDGTDDIISTADLPAATWYGSGTPQITWINVLAYRNTGRLSMRLQRTTANTNRIQIDRQAGDGGGDVAFSADNSTGTITSAPHAGFDWYIETVRWTNGGTPTLRRTSSAGTNTYDANGAVTGTPSGDLAAHVGYGTIAPAQFDIAEHLIYARNLTDTEMGQIEAYLLAKWGTI